MKDKKLTASDYVEQLTGEKMPVKEDVVEDKRILAIVGTAGSNYKTPWDDPRVTIWGVGHCLLQKEVRRLDKVWEIHLPYIYNQELSPFIKQQTGEEKPIVHHANKEYSIFGREKKDIKTVLLEPDENLNSYEVFDRQAIIDKYKSLLPPSDGFYATNSIAWMILQGIEEGFDEIHLYGIHLETDTEWQFERPCNEYWLGVFTGLMLAKGKKGVVYIPEESDVLRGYHEYGSADIEVTRKKRQARVQFYEKHINELQQQRMMIVNSINQLVGEKKVSFEQKIKGYEEQIKLLSSEVKKYKENKKDYENIVLGNIENKLAELQNNLKNLDARLHQFMGAKDCALYYLKELNA